MSVSRQNFTRCFWRTSWSCCRNRTSVSSSSVTAKTWQARRTPNTSSAPSSSSTLCWCARWPQVSQRLAARLCVHTHTRTHVVHLERLSLSLSSARQQVLLRPLHVRKRTPDLRADGPHGLGSDDVRPQPVRTVYGQEAVVVKQTNHQ